MPDLDDFLVPGEYPNELITLLLLPGEKALWPFAWQVIQLRLVLSPWKTKVSDDCCVKKNKGLV